MQLEKLLIANRGEIAVRIIRACHELGIAAVAVYSEADRAALHVRLADEAYPIGPAPATASYLRVEQIIAAARQSGAAAIHPGYGFLSERAHFARACREAGLIFVGPPPEAIELMGSKIAAKRLAESVGVPTVPGYLGDDQSPERLWAEAARVGVPLLIKASAGGGGKGMRTVLDLADFDAALAGAQREARAAFGDDAVFLERLIARPRHVEIQVLVDGLGQGVFLFERECSIQRRHQKIIEESPSPALTPALRAEMGAAAVRLALAAGYRNAGTVEFMLDADGHYYFLEMNTRLQVEHPVTELVTGLDLVQLQIAIACGANLPWAQGQLSLRGHAIEARLYAEDARTFLPATGRVALFAPPAGPGLRNDAGLASGDEVTVHYDPLLAKLIVSAPDRATAVARLAQALREYVVLGVTTNLPLLQAIAAHPAFAEGATTTAFLEEHDLTASLAEPTSVPAVVLTAVALAEAAQLPADPWRAGPWRLPHGELRLRYGAGEAGHTVSLVRQEAGWRVTLGAETHSVTLLAQQDDWLTLAFERAAGGMRIERVALAREAGDWLASWQGQAFRLAAVAPLSTDGLGARAGAHAGHAGLVAPMPGTVIKVLVAAGEAVAARQPLVVLEAMKMEHVVAAPHDGVVARLYYAPGALVAKGATLVELDS